MIRIYTQSEQGITRAVGLDEPVNREAAIFWIDLLTPDAQELSFAEELCGVEMPTKDEMREIEATSRLYCEDGARFMTTTVLSRVETDEPTISEITFIQGKYSRNYSSHGFVPLPGVFSHSAAHAGN